MSTYDDEKKAWNWKKYIAWHVKHHIILKNVTEYGYQCLDPKTKVHDLLNNMRCGKLYTVATTVRAHPDKHEKDFETIFTYLSQYIDERGPKPIVELCQLLRPNLPSDRRLVLLMGPSYKKSSWNLTQVQWHNDNSYTSSHVVQDSKRVRSPQKAARP